MATVTIEYFGFEGVGRNVTEAKRDAGRKIEALHRGSWSPILLDGGSYRMLLYRTLDGWRSASIDTDGKTGGMQWHDSLEEAEKSCRRHVASNVTDWRTCFTADDVHPICIDPKDRADIAHTCQWQRDYRRAVDAGLDDMNARHFLSGFTQFMTQPIPDSLQPA